MTRKLFRVLTFVLVGAFTAIGGCDDDDNNNTTGLGGRGGTTGTGGSGATAPTSCTDPLPIMQVLDTTGHSHALTIPASVLNATTPQTFDTSVTMGHMHTLTLELGQIAVVRSGGSVTVTTSINDAHGHMYTISCN